jgi:arginine N-succinyltransferase
MPKYPIYIPLLPLSVQAVIGRVHYETVPALNLLLAEGFVQTTEVDIFDAGPLVRATLAEVRTVKLTRVVVVDNLIPPRPPTKPTHLIGNEALDFRAAVGTFTDEPEGSSVSLEKDLAEALRLQPGDKVSLTPIR